MVGDDALESGVPETLPGGTLAVLLVAEFG
jgi:hypothetical protein